MGDVVTGSNSLRLSVEDGRPELTQGEFAGRQWPGDFMGLVRPLQSLFLLRPEVFEKLSQPLAIRLIRPCKGDEGEGCVGDGIMSAGRVFARPSITPGILKTSSTRSHLTSGNSLPEILMDELMKMASVARQATRGPRPSQRRIWSQEGAPGSWEHLASISVTSNRIPCNLTCASLRPTKKRVPSVAWRTKSPRLWEPMSRASHLVFNVASLFVISSFTPGIAAGSSSFA